jgi:pilus assembly protein FimV
MEDALNLPALTPLRPRLVFTQAALAVACLMAGSAAQALGLGRLQVQSALGETLRAEIEVSSLSPEEESSLRVRVAPPDVFRAQGLEYNAVLAATQVQLVRQSNGRVVLRLSSDRAVLEPFLDVLLDIRWATGRLNREYTLLFDPPSNSPTATAATPAPLAPPVVSAAPSPAAPSMAAAPRPAPATAPRAPAAPRPAPPSDGAIVVRPGDSLSRLADANRGPGVSLDQMLVALYRENPDAFIQGNMNLLKAGARLRRPGSDLIQSVPADEARRLVRTHSSNFDAVRQGLASAAPKLPAESERVAKGAVQPQVAETRPAAPGGDRLTLSKPGAASAAPAPTSPAAPATPAAPSASKLAEVARDVEAARKLAEATKQEVALGASAPLAAEAASAVASMAAALPASVPPVMAASAPTVAKAPEPAPEPESGLLDMLLSPLGAAAGVGVLALGAVLAVRLSRQRKTKPTQETLFGESRLQPDSFFGVTGGQRVDTRDGAASGVSSMSYSLSQLDAHGDVDPVAEADVYLAYGRDLQAEEILKEALRAQPERLTIRLKLLEVYAKRRDVRGYEQLATQLYAETKGSGEDWENAQEMGRGIDPENSLYQPGGSPRSMFDEDAPRPEPMNATTLPQAAPLSRLEPEPEPDQGPPSLIDLDLDLSGSVAAPPAMDRTQAMPALPPIDAGPTSMSMDLDISEAMPLDGRKDNSLEFDLSDMGDLRDLGGTTVSSNLGGDTTARMGLPSQPGDLDDSPVTKVGGDSLIDAMQELDDADPMMRQLELADEFRQIGDMEGARDVLQELLAQVDSGPLYEKAKAMLDELR